MQIREFGTSWIVNQLIRKEGKSSTCIATRIEILLVFSEMASFYRTQASIIFYAITHVSRWLINDRTLKIVELTLVDVIKYLRNVDVEMKLRYARREGWVLPDSIQCLNFAEKMIHKIQNSFSLNRYTPKFSGLPQKLTWCQKVGLQVFQSEVMLIFVRSKRPF